MRRAVRITLSLEELARLRHLAGERATPGRIRLRARIVLGAAVGWSNREIARALRLHPATVSSWRRRFREERLSRGLKDAPRPGHRSARSVGISERVLHTTLNVPPPQGLRWSTRTLARYLGVNHMRVYRAWKAEGLRPAGPLEEAPSSSFDSGREGT